MFPTPSVARMLRVKLSLSAQVRLAVQLLPSQVAGDQLVHVAVVDLQTSQLTTPAPSLKLVDRPKAAGTRVAVTLPVGITVPAVGPWVSQVRVSGVSVP